jgi:hypothetical protein
MYMLNVIFKILAYSVKNGLLLHKCLNHFGIKLEQCKQHNPPLPPGVQI